MPPDLLQGGLLPWPFWNALTGDFTTILTELDAVVKQSVSATLEGSSDFNFSTGRCAVRVYERYSAIGNGRVTMSLTLLEADGQIRLSAITSGGSQAVFFKVNTFGAESSWIPSGTQWNALPLVHTKITKLL